MTDLTPSEDSPSSWKRHLLAGVAALLVLGFGAYGISSTSVPIQKKMRDYTLVQTGAECLFDGCNPYLVQSMVQESLQRGEHKHEPLQEEPVYPPSTLLLVSPIALMGWPLSGYVWNWFSLALFAAICAFAIERFRVERYWPALCVLPALAASRALWMSLYTGNPSLTAASLAIAGCMLMVRREWQAPRNRFNHAGWIVLGVSLALKPQVAIGALAVLLLLRAHRKDASKAAALACVLLVLGVAAYRLRTGSFPFLTQLWLNNRMALLPGGSSDPSLVTNPDAVTFLSAQSIAYYLGARALVPSIFAWSVTLTAIMLMVLARRRSAAARSMFWTTLCLGVVISLFPVYHRLYDRVLAVLVVPAIMELYERGKERLAMAVSLTAIF